MKGGVGGEVCSSGGAATGCSWWWPVAVTLASPSVTYTLSYMETILENSSCLCSASLAASFLFILIKFKKAAFRRRFLPRTFCRAHIPTLNDAFLLIICVGGVANGLLSRDVMSSSRSLLFFFPKFPEPSPSTSARCRYLFSRDRGVGIEAGECECEGSSSAEVAVELIGTGRGLKRCHSHSISTE